MNTFKQGLVSLLTAAAPVAAIAAGGHWDGVADEGTAFPYTVFQIFDQEPIYGFGARVGWRLLVMLKALARDTDAATGNELVDALFDAVLAATEDEAAPLAVAGHTVEVFQLLRMLPTPSYNAPDTAERGTVTYQKAGLYEVVLTPAA